jgi:hypothetical protein
MVRIVPSSGLIIQLAVLRPVCDKTSSATRVVAERTALCVSHVCSTYKANTLST